jgi:hypothetical protein
MKMLPTSVLVLACAIAPAAFAQWQWIDSSGRKVFSDQPPPPSVPAGKILKRPGNRPVEPEPVAAAAPAATAAASAASAPKVSGKDKTLEEKKKQAAAADAEKKKEQEEENAKARAENCDIAKRAKATLDSGMRVSTTNSKGEREIMSDEQRAAEGKRLDTIISRDCKAAG